MLGTRTREQWIAQYAGSHRHPVNRACHTFDSNKSPQFIVLNAIGVPSQSGKFIAFTSDIGQSLGTDPKGVPRGDVFIVKAG